MKALTAQALNMNTATRVADARAPDLAASLSAQHSDCACARSSARVAECENCRRKRLGVQRYSLDGSGRNARGIQDPARLERVVQTPGTVLDAGTKSLMNSRFGHDFSRVRIHSDAAAAASARAERAHAYTLGEHVVFGHGRYAPATTEGRRLLAHELAHVVQQTENTGSVTLPGATSEAEADHAARAVTHNLPVPVIGSVNAPVIQRDDAEPEALSPESQVSRAELMCDLRTLCRLHFASRDIVPVERVRRAYRACRPGSLATTALNPCLALDFATLREVTEPGGATSPGRSPPTTAPAPAAGSSGGLSLPSTNVRFSLGPVELNIDLPSSLTARLPIPFQGARVLEIGLEATTSGRFTFNVTINAVPHVRIILRARASVEERRGSAGVVVETTRTVCRATDESTARTQLEAAGERLRNAIQTAQNPPEPAADEDPAMERLSRLADVVSALVNVHQAVERVRAPCREVPLAAFEFGVQGPLGEQEPGHERERGAVPYVGGTATLRF